jgi:hypothetical protein
MLKQRHLDKAVVGEYLTVIALATLALCSAQLTACKKKPPAPVREPDPSAEVPEIVEPALPAPSAEPAPGPVPARCHELAQGSPFRIGEVAVSKPAPDDADDGGPDDDDEVPAPFSVELGQARSDADGFVISALRSLKGQSHALIAVLDNAAGGGKLIDLGAVHGDPDPPLFAEHGKDLLIAACDADAGGGMLKIGLVHDARGAAQVSWGPEITGVRRDSTFALEVTGERALVAYATESGGKIRVYGAALDPSNLKQKVTPEALSAAGSDVDSPRLALRKGGYWLAVARSLDAPKLKAKPKPDDAASDIGEEDSLLDIGTRRIEVTKLDTQGKAASSALVVTAAGARPMSFELASAADGGAYIAYRGDDSTPGADGGALELVHVKADGTFDKVPLSGDDNGTGTPSLLVDSSDATRVWLAAPGENSSTWFGRIVDHTTMAPDALVRGGDLIAGRDGKLLLSRSKGTAAEFSLVQCGD